MEAHHWSEIEEVRNRARFLVASSRARRKVAAKQTARIDELQRDLARTNLLVIALAELCLEKGVLSKPELDAKLRAIDAEDGVEDGKAPATRAVKPRGRSVR